MWGGVWYAGLVWGGYIFDPADFGPFTLNLNPCFDAALGYAGAWYAGIVYAGTPFCPTDFGLVGPPSPRSNVQDLCIIDC